jgi:hypothetical protein
LKNFHVPNGWMNVPAWLAVFRWNIGTCKIKALTLRQTCMLRVCLGVTAAAQVPPAQVDERTAHVRSRYERYVKRDAEHHKRACKIFLIVFWFINSKSDD